MCFIVNVEANGRSGRLCGSFSTCKLLVALPRLKCELSGSIHDMRLHMSVLKRVEEMAIRGSISTSYHFEPTDLRSPIGD